MPNIPWHGDHVESLKKLWADGLSCSEIAAEMRNQFGVALTRSAIIGKVHRLKLDKRREINKPKRQHGAVGPSGTHIVHRLQARQRLIKNQVMLVNEPVDLPAFPFESQNQPPHQGKKLLELENHHCRWPIGNVGDPDFFFCGHPSADFDRKRPYCAVHAMAAGRKYDLARGMQTDPRRGHTLRMTGVNLPAYNPLDQLDGDAA